MSTVLTLPPSFFAGTRLVRTIVLTLLWCSLTLGFSGIASAGCYYGHGKQAQSSSHSTETRGYARNFRFLGQWVYEGGQIQYVAWQADGQCHGPNCSANRMPQEGAGMSLPQLNRTLLSAAHFQAHTHLSIPGLSDAMPLEDVNASHGYPPAYEYPP